MVQRVQKIERCVQIKEDGTRCEEPAEKGRLYCRDHSPESAKGGAGGRRGFKRVRVYKR